MSTIKILCFAILGMVAGNAEYALTAAPVLDFDTIAVHNANIPSSFQPKWSANIPAGINVPNGRYIYFTVVPNGGGAAGNVNFAPLNIHGAAPAAPRAPVAGDINIYFPADGSQPTTPEAVEYSCANIDNRESSPITEWYMKMFGVIPFQNTGNPANDYIKAGWSDPGVGVPIEQRIISFPPPGALNQAGDVHHQINATDVPDPNIPGNHISRIGLFQRLFRKIASTPVGRVLLYRILIEIRRHVGLGNNVGCLENGIVAPVRFAGGIGIRNINRSISVYTSDHSSYNKSYRKIRIREVNGRHTIIGKTTAHNNNGYTAIGKANSSIDISLFHEMTHWYHYLRNPKQYTYESDGTNLDLQNYYLGAYYWSGLDNCVTQWNTARRMVSQEAWGDFEEIRTILGVPCGGNIQRYNGVYKNGDDLCENLYRIDIGAPLRFGHDANKFYEDRKVINKVLNAVNESHVFYMNGYTSLRNINYNRARQGLGSCWRL